MYFCKVLNSDFKTALNPFHTEQFNQLLNSKLKGKLSYYLIGVIGFTTTYAISKHHH